MRTNQRKIEEVYQPKQEIPAKHLQLITSLLSASPILKSVFNTRPLDHNCGTFKQQEIENVDFNNVQVTIAN